MTPLVGDLGPYLDNDMVSILRGSYNFATFAFPIRLRRRLNIECTLGRRLQRALAGNDMGRIQRVPQLKGKHA